MKGWSFRKSLPPEQKASVAKRLLVTTPGRPQWTPRDYESLAREGFAKNPIVYRCIRLIAEACASAPLVVFHDGERAADHPVQRLLERPNPEQGGADLMESFFGSLQTAGNAYLEAASTSGLPDELCALRPDRMKVIPGANGWPEGYEYRAGTRTARIGRDASGWLPVLHLKLFHPADDHYGFSPLEAAAFAIDVHNASGAWNKALLDNSARPSGALVYSGGDRLSSEQFEQLKSEITDLHSGTAAAGRPLLLDGGLDWRPMSMSPADMDFINGKHAAAREIALAFGVPPQLLGIPGDATYSNYREATASLWRQTVIPLAERAARALTNWLEPKYPGIRIAPDLDRVPALTGEREALWARLDAASFLTAEERRKMAGLV